MINQEFKAKGTKYQVQSNFFGSAAGSYQGSKLRVFAHACAVSALFMQHLKVFKAKLFSIWNALNL